MWAIIVFFIQDSSQKCIQPVRFSQPYQLLRVAIQESHRSLRLRVAKELPTPQQVGLRSIEHALLVVK